MPILRIVVVDAPPEWPGYLWIKLLLQTPAGHSGPVNEGSGEIVFDVPFKLKADRSGVVQPSGPLVQRQNDGRRFVYLSWWGSQDGVASMFRRLKVFFDLIPGFPGTEEVYELRVRGKDKRGGPACATAEVA